MALNGTRSQHHTSDALEDRYPYFPEQNTASFASEINPNEVFMAYGDRCLPKLSNVLGNDSLSADTHAEALTLVLASIPSVEGKSEAINIGMVQSVTKLLTHECVKVRSLSVQVLAKLFSLRSGRLEHRPSINIVVTLLGDPSSNVRCEASKAIAVFLREKEGVGYFLQSPSLISCITDHIPDKLHEINMVLLESLEFLTRNELGTNFNIVEKLVILSSVKDLRTSVASVCWNITDTLPGKDALINAGMVDILASYITDSADTSLLASVTGSILGISVEKQGKLAIGNVASAICSLLISCNGTDVYVNTIKIIRSASEEPNVKRTFVELLILDGEVLLEIFESECSSDLICILTKNSTKDVVFSALETLLKIVENGNYDVVFGCLHSIETIASFLNSKNGLIARYAKDILGIMRASCGPSADRRLEKFASKHSIVQLEDEMKNQEAKM